MKSHTVIFLAAIQSCSIGCEARSAREPVGAVGKSPAVAIYPLEMASVAPLPWSSSKYFALHEDLLSSDPEQWRPAAVALKQLGDRFTLALINKEQSQEQTPEKQTALAALSAAIQPKFNEFHPAEVQGLLERDAYTDMMCPEVEYALRDWTMEFLRDQLHRPEIREEIVRLEESYVCDERILELEKTLPSDPVWREIQAEQWKEKAQFHRMNEEVKLRVSRLLRSPIPVPDL